MSSDIEHSKNVAADEANLTHHTFGEVNSRIDDILMSREILDSKVHRLNDRIEKFDCSLVDSSDKLKILILENK